MERTQKQEVLLMADPDTDVFHAELIDDALGQGVRLYDATDTVHEMRENDAGTRIYTEDGTWHVKTRIPVDKDEEEAYEAFRDTAHRIGDAHGWDVTVPAYSFMDGDHRLPLEPDELSGDLRYNREDQTDPGVYVEAELGTRHAAKAWAKNFVGVNGVLGSVGAGVGGLGGLLLGDPVTGAMVGAGVGGGLGTLGSLADIAAYSEGDPDSPTYQSMEQKREALEENGAERLRENDHLGNATLLDRVNERNRLAAEIDEIEDFEQAERLKDLEAGDAGVVFDTAMDLHFDQFHRWDGVIADVEVDAYADAYRFAAAVADTPQETVERPSIYADRDAFSGVFEALPDADRDVLVANVLEHGASDAVTAYLDAQHAERVRRVGGETVLDAGMEEGSDR